MEVCVFGDNVLHASQLITIPADIRTDEDLRNYLSQRVSFSPPDCNRITSMKRHDPRYQEWVPVEPNLANIRNFSDSDASVRKIFLFSEKNPFALLEAKFYAMTVECFMKAQVAPASVDASQLRSAIDDARLLFLGRTGVFSAEEVAQGAPLQRIAQLLRSPVASFAPPVASSRAPDRDLGGAAAAATSTPSAVTPRKRVPSTPADAAVPASSDAAVRARKSAPPPSTGASASVNGAADFSAYNSTEPVQNSNRTSSSAGLSLSDNLTVYCVYSTTATQRAKAIVISRRAPSLDQLLNLLKAKFHSDLVLGHIEVDGSVQEIATQSLLEDLVARLPAAVESLTLHCWAKSAVSFGAAQDYGEDGTSAHAQNQSNLSRATSEASSTGPSKPNKSARPTSAASGGRQQAKVMKSSRPGSAASVRSTGSGGKRFEITPSNPLDVSGLPSSAEQVQQLFDQLDIDGSGILSEDEFLNFFLHQYDSMGVPGFEKKIRQLVRSMPEFNGGLSVMEFGQVMLKVAQW